MALLKSRHYHFAARVSVTTLDPKTFFSADGANTIVVAGERIQFKCSKSLGKEPNPSEVTISNLAVNTRAQFQRKPLQVLVEAGYDGLFSTMFIGDLIYADSQRKGPDWETVMQISDGARAFTQARVKRAFEPGTTRLAALGEIAKSMNLRIPQSILNAPELQAQFASGITLSGASQRAMTDVLNAANMGWSIQDGSLQILRQDDVLPGQALQISQKSGMIGSPEFGPPQKDGKPPTLKIKHDLRPEIVPGMQIDVESESISGIFRVQKVDHRGDTRGKDHVTEIEATRT